MKKQVQKGFTLIELMIVVAIIGILASIALPAYKTYVVKSKIGGPVMTQIGGIKLDVFEEYVDLGSMPVQATLTAYGAALDAHDNIVVGNAGADFARTNDDVATLVMDLENIGSVVDGETMTIVFDGSQPTHGFTCTTAATLLPKYLPKVCRP